MARFLRELLRNHSSRRFMSTFTHQNPSNLSPQLFLNQSFDHGCSLNPSKDQSLREIDCFSKLQIYPSFSFGFFINPNFSSGSGLSQLVEPEMEQNGMIWADSVKKKRKKKMNKHKYKKRIKLLRRKTKKN